MNGFYDFMRRVGSLLILAMLLLGAWPQPGRAQPSGIDPQAEKLLRRMSDYLAGRQQFSLKAESTLEVVLTSGQKIQFDSPATLVVSRPNKLWAHRRGDIANQEFFYDGKILTAFSSAFVVGPSVVAGTKTTHLAFRAADVDGQVWIDDGDKPLPRKFILTSKQVKGEPEFTMVIRSWDLAPKVTDKEFAFVPSKGAKKIEFLSLTEGVAKVQPK